MAEVAAGAVPVRVAEDPVIRLLCVRHISRGFITYIRGDFIRGPLFLTRLVVPPLITTPHQHV